MLVSRCLKSTRTLLLAGLLLLPAMSPMAAGQTFTNPNTILIPPQGSAQPYPSTIEVSGLNAPIESLSVSLNGLTHNRPQDLQVLLVGPTGASVVLMARAGGIDPVASVVMMFVDGAPLVPFQLTSGFYQPTQVDVTDFETPAPAPPYGTTLSVFDDTDGNGTWELYVLDLDSGDGGVINAWSLEISTSTRAPLTYQGRLSQDGNPLNDSADLEFSVWDAEVDGNRIGSVMSADNVPVVDGFFTVELPIPHSAFDGSPRWLEVAASSPAGIGPFVTLTPRQRVTATPEATHATTADRATSAMTAANATTAATATTAGSANSVGGVLFNSDGKIGIGTETPEALLDINGRLIVRTPAASTEGGAVQILGPGAAVEGTDPSGNPGFALRVDDRDTGVLRLSNATTENVGVSAHADSPIHEGGEINVHDENGNPVIALIGDDSLGINEQAAKVVLYDWTSGSPTEAISIRNNNASGSRPRGAELAVNYPNGNTGIRAFTLSAFSILQLWTHDGHIGATLRPTFFSLANDDGIPTIRFDGRTGAKNAVVTTENHGQRLLYAVESTEVWFDDRGSSQLVNGQAEIKLEPVFLETVRIDDEHPLRVFVSLTSDCNGVWIEKLHDRFIVHELAGGTSNATFDYRVEAKRRGLEDARLDPFTNN